MYKTIILPAVFAWLQNVLKQEQKFRVFAKKFTWKMWSVFEILCKLKLT